MSVPEENQYVQLTRQRCALALFCIVGVAFGAFKTITDIDVAPLEVAMDNSRVCCCLDHSFPFWSLVDGRCHSRNEHYEKTAPCLAFDTDDWHDSVDSVFKQFVSLCLLSLIPVKNISFSRVQMNHIGHNELLIVMCTIIVYVAFNILSKTCSLTSELDLVCVNFETKQGALSPLAVIKIQMAQFNIDFYFVYVWSFVILFGTLCAIGRRCSVSNVH